MFLELFKVKIPNIYISLLNVFAGNILKILLRYLFRIFFPIRERVGKN